MEVDGVQKNMKKVDRGMKLLERIKARTGLSEDGLQWLVAVLDPSHDERLECNGYPDRNVGPSVVQVIKQSYDVSMPDWGTAPAAWGFHVYCDDYLCNDVAMQSTSYSWVENNNVNADSSNPPSRLFEFGGLNVVAHNETTGSSSDITTYPNTSSRGDNNIPILGVGSSQFTTPDNPFMVGKLRKIAESFEVCNTTADIYRSGACAVYEQPTSKQDAVAYYIRTTTPTLDPDIVAKYGKENIFVEDPIVTIHDDHCEDHKDAPKTLASDSPNSVVVKCEKTREVIPKRFYVLEKGVKVYLDKYVTPVVRHGVQSLTVDNLRPRSLKEAMLLPGTAQWKAADGCYCVQTMSDLANPPSFSTTAASIYTVNEMVWPNANTTNDFNVTPYIPNYSADATQGVICPFNNVKTPFNAKGAMFTGLTPQSTFKINRTIVIERFISSQDGNLAVLAKMSPAEDYVALAFYSEIVKHMPIGCKFDDNSLGDWFLGIADGIADFVGSIGKPIMGAVDGWKSSRQGGAPVPEKPPVMAQKTVKVKPAVKMQAGKATKKGVVAGPRLPTGNFKSAGAKQISAAKKGKK